MQEPASWAWSDWMRQREFDGFDMPVEAMVGVNEELGKTCIDYYFPPDSPICGMLMLTCTLSSVSGISSLMPRGEKISAIGISEPSGGGDPAAMKTKAVLDDGIMYSTDGRFGSARRPTLISPC